MGGWGSLGCRLPDFELSRLQPSPYPRHARSQVHAALLRSACQVQRRAEGRKGGLWQKAKIRQACAQAGTPLFSPAAAAEGTFRLLTLCTCRALAMHSLSTHQTRIGLTPRSAEASESSDRAKKGRPCYAAEGRLSSARARRARHALFSSTIPCPSLRGVALVRVGGPHHAAAAPEASPAPACLVPSSFCNA